MKDEWSFSATLANQSIKDEVSFFLLTGGCFFLNIIIHFIQNYLAKSTNDMVWWIYEVARGFIKKTLFVIPYSYIHLCFLHFFYSLHNWQFLLGIFIYIIYTFFYISNLVVKTPGLSLVKNLNNLLGNHETLN